MERQHIEDFEPQRRDEPAENGHDYEKYKSLGGILNPEVYEDVIKRAGNGGSGRPESSSPRHAKFIAQEAGITLSPEAISIYQMLRDTEPDPAKENFSGLSDQRLLAEALRLVGDMESLAALMKRYPNIFGS